MSYTLGQPLKELPKIPEASEPVEFDADDFLRQLHEDPNVAGSDGLDNLTNEQLGELYKRMSAYSAMACDPPPANGIQEVAFASFENLRDSYMKRFITTSMVGFIYQMAHEYTFSDLDRNWVPEKIPDQKPYDVDEIYKKAEHLFRVATEARESHRLHLEVTANHLKVRELREKHANTIKLAKMEAEDKTKPDVEYLTDEAERNEYQELLKFGTQEDMDKNERDYLMNFEFCRYMATYQMYLFGKSSHPRLNETRKRTFAFQEAKKRCEESGIKPVQDMGSYTIPQKVATGLVKTFLNNTFKFDPSIHVRSGASNGVKSMKRDVIRKDAFNEEPYYVNDLNELGEDKFDPTHFTLEQINSSRLRLKSTDPMLPDINYICDNKIRYNFFLTLAKGEYDEDIIKRVMASDESKRKYRHYLVPQINKMLSLNDVTKKMGSVSDLPTHIIPPQDSFNRFSYYMEVNDSVLRTVTEAIYPEKADLDAIISLWAYHIGTEKENKAAFKEHTRKFQEQTPGNIIMLEFGKRTFVSNHENNRKNMDIYNQNNIVLQRIIERHAEDAKTGRDMMKQRIVNKKRENIREAGPDAEGLKGYSRQNNTMQTTLTDEERLKLKASSGDINAINELKHVEELRTTIRDAEAKIASGETLESGEAERYRSAKEELPRAEEAMSVPDGAVQVDVYVTKGDTIVKEVIYTKAD